MANNGYSFSGECLTSLHEYYFNICPSGTSFVISPALNDAGVCFNSSWAEIGKVSVISPNCQIPGPPLTESQQIEAINGLFPHAVAILAIAWGLRYIRVLVSEWLKERNAND